VTPNQAYENLSPLFFGAVPGSQHMHPSWYGESKKNQQVVSLYCSFLPLICLHFGAIATSTETSSRYPLELYGFSA
jgi:hypothetical protein